MRQARLEADQVETLLSPAGLWGEGPASAGA
jgi:hypothetical protein